MSMSGTEIHLPRQRKKAPDVRLQTVEFAVDDHTIFGAVTVSPLYHHMHTYARLLRVRTGDMKFSRSFGITVLEKRPLHTLLYNFPAAGQPPHFISGPFSVDNRNQQTSNCQTACRSGGKHPFNCLGTLVPL